MRERERHRALTRSGSFSPVLRCPHCQVKSRWWGVSLSSTAAPPLLSAAALPHFNHCDFQCRRTHSNTHLGLHIPSLRPVCLHPLFVFFIFICKSVYPLFLIWGYLFLPAYLSSLHFFPLCLTFFFFFSNLSFFEPRRHPANCFTVWVHPFVYVGFHPSLRSSYISHCERKLPSRYGSKDWLDLTRWVSGTKRHSTYKLGRQHIICHSEMSSCMSLFSWLCLSDCILLGLLPLLVRHTGDDGLELITIDEVCVLKPVIASRMTSKSFQSPLVTTS